MLVDFFNPDALAGQVIDALANPARYHLLQEAARRTIVEHYDLKQICLPRQTRLVDRLTRE